jgi:hypothetical protein
MKKRELKTLPQLIAESREFVRQTWGQEEACLHFYAPLTRMDGLTWVHPAWAREASWRDITRRAERIWSLSGSFWIPGLFRLIWHAPWALVPEGEGALRGGGQ